MSDYCKHGVRDIRTNLPYCRYCDAEARSELAATTGSGNPQDETYARLRLAGWVPMIGVLVLKKDGQLALIDAAGELRVTADSPNKEITNKNEYPALSAKTDKK